MILADPETIRNYTESGIYSTKTLMDYLEGNGVKNPDKICIVDPPNRKELNGFDPERITYGEFLRAVDAVGEALLDLGVKKDDVVVVQLPNSWELAMLYFAVSKAGGIISPVPVLWREAELGYVAELTRARVFITLDEFNGFKHFEMGESLKAKSPAMTHLLNFKEIRKNPFSCACILSASPEISLGPCAVTAATNWPMP